MPQMYETGGTMIRRVLSQKSRLCEAATSAPGGLQGTVRERRAYKGHAAEVQNIEQNTLCVGGNARPGAQERDVETDKKRPPVMPQTSPTERDQHMEDVLCGL